MRDEVKMDANRLIAEVHKRPALWNQRHISYHNREVTNRVWMEIATIFKLPKPVLKAKWKGLRDTFRAELKKEQVFRKSKFHRTRPVWIHFKSLQFLKEQMLPRPPIWERKSSEGTVGVDDAAVGNDDGFLRSDDNAASMDHGPSSNGGGNFGRHGDGTGRDIDVKREPGDGLEHLGFQNVAQSFSDNEMMLQNISPEHVLMGDADANISLSADPLDGGRFDDNYYFLMSLLPHIRTLAGDKQMWLRIQMQELVYKEVYKKNEPDPKQPSKNT